MKIALYGATGNIGKRILNEALTRGHKVTAIVRDVKKIGTVHKNLTVKTGDILFTDHVSHDIAGNDVVISAYGPGFTNPQLVVQATISLINGVKQSGVKRLIVIGGAGSLTVAPGLELADSPQFPADWKPIANAHRDALKLYLDEKELRWSYASPAAFIEPGKRTGKFRWGENQLLTDSEGNSKISMEDFAIAIIDEAEQAAHIRKQFTVSY